MTQDMIVRGLDKTTQHAYLHAVTELSAYYHRSPDTLSKQELHDYLLYLSQERGLAWSTCNGRVHALRFFYRVTLGRPDVALVLPRAKEPLQTPCHLEPTRYPPPLGWGPRPARAGLAQDGVRYRTARQRSHSAQNHRYRQPTDVDPCRARQAQQGSLTLLSPDLLLDRGPIGARAPLRPLALPQSPRTGPISTSPRTASSMKPKRVPALPKPALCMHFVMRSRRISWKRALTCIRYSAS